MRRILGTFLLILAPCTVSGCATPGNCWQPENLDTLAEEEGLLGGRLHLTGGRGMSWSPGQGRGGAA